MSRTTRKTDPFNAWSSLETAAGKVRIHRLAALEDAGLGPVSRLPVVIKILLESALRNHDGFAVTDAHVRAIAAWNAAAPADLEVPFLPSRVLLQDFTGVPSIVDLAAIRAAVARLGGDPARVNPRVPADLVIDHSVQVDAFGTAAALGLNMRREFERNRERYEFLHWGQRAFEDFRVVPPATGIVHQVNLEYLATVVARRGRDAFPDSLVGTDSHTTMINGLGVLGWGVGGIEAEAVMLGQPIYMLLPRVVGVQLEGALPEGATATDLVLRVTQLLRAHGVVDKLVEFYGDGVARLSLADRATVANMAPEYGATTGFFPVDDETLSYLRRTGRPRKLVDLVERYCKEQGLFRAPGASPATYSEYVALDMSTIEPSIAGPARPQDRVRLRDAKRGFFLAMRDTYKKPVGADDEPAAATAGTTPRVPRRRDLYRAARVPLEIAGQDTFVTHGALAIAAITSCTNTSNPSVMLGAGLLARNAVARGLDVKPWVKTSLAPGSRVVTRYLDRAGLTPYLDALRFHTVGYGCTTCIGNSGTIVEPLARVAKQHDLVLAAVLSGNRNFEGRINSLVKANYLASPPLVVAYALAGTIDIDLDTEPLSLDPNGEPVWLRDVWPSQEAVRAAVDAALDPDLFAAEYAGVFQANEMWNRIESRGGVLYEWNRDSTYIQEPPFFKDLTLDAPPPRPIAGARVLAVLGDSVTTDHISPAGDIAATSSAAEYLRGRGVAPADFNAYGARRGNHEVMMRGTFANIRVRNRLLPGTEGGVTVHLPSGEKASIYDAAMRYRAEGTPLVILAGKDYGMGSSRDWAAKGVFLLGVQAVIAQSYERIHRSNLVGMGVLPLQFKKGEGAESLGLTGREVFAITVPAEPQPGQETSVHVRDEQGRERTFAVVVRLDSAIERRYWQQGGILHTVLRDMVRGG